MADSQLDLARSFRDEGGSVVLPGSSDAPSAARGTLDAVVEAPGSDPRSGDDRVRDGTETVGNDPRVLTTTRFDRRYPLFGAFTPEESESRRSVATVHADAAGDDAANLTDEYVTLVNAGDGPLDVTSYTVEDAAGNTFEFPTMTLRSGGQVTVRTGTGTDQVVLHWGRRTPVWNNREDTVIVRDDEGAEVDRYEYSR